MAFSAVAFVSKACRFARCRARRLRWIHAPSTPHPSRRRHLPVTARGNRQQEIFRSGTDFELYRAMLRRVARRLGWRIIEYCLMPDHVHLVFETPQPICHAVCSGCTVRTPHASTSGTGSPGICSRAGSIPCWSRTTNTSRNSLVTFPITPFELGSARTRTSGRGAARRRARHVPRGHGRGLTPDTARMGA